MTDRYHVVVVGEFDWTDWTEVQGKDEYDIYDMWLDPEVESLPHGVWVDTWYVEDDASWESHPLHNQYHLVGEQCHLIDWNEIEKPWMIKDEKWWKEKIETMDALYDMMKSVYPVAEKIIDTVVDILDPDRESLNEAMQGEIYWPDYYTLGHFRWIAKDKTGYKEEKKDGE